MSCTETKATACTEPTRSPSSFACLLCLLPARLQAPANRSAVFLANQVSDVEKKHKEMLCEARYTYGEITFPSFARVFFHHIKVSGICLVSADLPRVRFLLASASFSISFWNRCANWGA